MGRPVARRGLKMMAVRDLWMVPVSLRMAEVQRLPPGVPGAWLRPPDRDFGPPGRCHPGYVEGETTHPPALCPGAGAGDPRGPDGGQDARCRGGNRGAAEPGNRGAPGRRTSHGLRHRAKCRGAIYLEIVFIKGFRHLDRHICTVDRCLNLDESCARRFQDISQGDFI